MCCADLQAICSSRPGLIRIVKTKLQYHEFSSKKLFVDLAQVEFVETDTKTVALHSAVNKCVALHSAVNKGYFIRHGHDY